MKIFTIVGARPQFIKAAVVSRAIRDTEGVEEVLVHTGQHFDANMSDVFFDEMEIPRPRYHLDINSMTHGKMTGRMLEGVEELMIKEKPDVVLVFGDTNSTLAGSLAAAKLHIPIAHVEAGLRSFNMAMPEEINRILTDRISHWLFCPTEQAIENLKKEGFSDFGINIHHSGDVMYDAALFYEKKLHEHPSRIQIPGNNFILATLHREENTKNVSRLKALVEGLNHIHENIHPVIMPLHPGTAKTLRSNDFTPKFEVINPVGYFDMIRLLKNSQLVITDSGGLQKEAFFFDKYCITMRDETEWVELVKNKVNYLVGANRDALIKAVNDVCKHKFPTGLTLYGEGAAGLEIVKVLSSYK